MENKDLEETVNVFHFPKSKLGEASSGVEKLQEFCCLAAKCGFRWAWSDTCCINKKDYAETSESINCMFLWYSGSDLTIVYLDDVDDGKYRKLPVWVKRGWTLQEMIASKKLRFYSKRWTLLEEANDPDTDEAEDKISISSFRYRARLVDHRASDVWGDVLVKSTGVPLEDLRKFRVGIRDVRSRLLWAAKRSTTKVEDMAYCLLGIFDISLPAMYGEGPRAFFRLQEELMKRTGDASLFDW
ncbi:hypothetical protein HD554DRAFT_2012365, partial [Boletus coccyginus]